MQCLLYFPTHVFFFRVDAKVSLVSSVYRPFDGAIAYRFSPATYQRAIVPVCHLQQENVFNWISSFILNLLYKKRIESPKGMSSESSRLSGTMRLLLLERIISIERAVLNHIGVVSSSSVPGGTGRDTREELNRRSPPPCKCEIGPLILSETAWKSSQHSLESKLPQGISVPWESHSCSRHLSGFKLKALTVIIWRYRVGVSPCITPSTTQQRPVCACIRDSRLFCTVCLFRGITRTR